MPKEFGERPYQAPTSQRETRQEAKHAANEPLPSLMQDEQAWSERTHKEMVDILRSLMEQYRRDRDPESHWFDPADWMRDELCGPAHMKVYIFGKRDLHTILALVTD